MFIWMIVLLSIVCADNGLGGGLSGKVGWCVTTGDLLKVKMFEEGQIRMIFCFLRPIFLIFGLKSIYRGNLAIEPHSSSESLARNFEGRRHPAAEVMVKRGSFKYLKIFFF